MRAGMLRHRIWADEAVASQDGFGGESVTWTPRLELWCSIEPIGGREALLAGQVLAEMDTRITVRWSPAASRITAKWRLRWPRRVGEDVVETLFDIARPPAEKDAARRELEFMCNSGLNQG